MKAIITCTVIAVLLHARVNAQSLRYATTDPYLSLGTYSYRQADPFSFSANQAALTREKRGAIGIYSERRFLLKETSSFRLAAVFPTALGNLGLKLDYAGFRDFNEYGIGLAYARGIGRQADAGIQFNYYGYRIPGYTSASTINFEAGVILHFSNKLQGGIHVYNPVGGKLVRSTNEKLATAYSIGMGYDASDNFFAGAEVIKEEDKPVNVRAGMQYHFARRFFARAGIISDSGSAFAGAGVGWDIFRLDISVSYHPQLGFSPGILLVMHFKGSGQ